SPHVGRELAQATLGMIGGQYLDVTGTAPDEATLHKLKTGCLFAASVGLALWVVEIPEREQAAWRAFGDELGLLFQIVDDILDGDGYVLTHGADGARALADQAAAPLRGAALRQLVEQVDWRSLDVRLIDLPPGTADLLQQLLGVVALAGAVVVVGPQDVAHLDARKFVDFLHGADVRVLGGVENMTALLCPYCGERTDVFPPAAPRRANWSDGVPLLGRMPLDPALDRHRPELDLIGAE